MPVCTAPMRLPPFRPASGGAFVKAQSLGVAPAELARVLEVDVDDLARQIVANAEAVFDL